jgi:hypothetical protein
VGKQTREVRNEVEQLFPHGWTSSEVISG